MDSNVASDATQKENTARRAFLAQVGKAAVTAPAVALLLTASAKPAAAAYTPQGYGGDSGPRRNVRRGGRRR